VSGHVIHFAVGETLGIRPVIVRWLTHDATYFLELVHFTCTREKRLKCVKLGHDATEGENINRIIVTPTS